MKKILVILMSMLALHVFSQKKDKSGSFEVPEGNSSVLQLKNGNTFFMEITKKEGIKVLMFDTLRKKISSSTLALKLLDEKIGHYIHEGAYEIGGDVAVFIQVAEDRTPILIRIIVDGKTGKLKSEEKVSALERVKAGGGYAMAFGGVDIPDFEISKDPESDYYALIRYNTMAPETKDRIEVLHCGPDHKVINKANYIAPNNKFRYTNYLSAYVNGSNYVLIATYAYNTDKTGGDEGQLYVSQLSKGKSGFKQQEMSYREFNKGLQCSFLYNKAKQMVHMCLLTSVTHTRKGRSIEQHFQNINPVTLKVDPEYAPDFTEVNAYYREKMERDDDFYGVLRKMAIDKSGNMVMFYQQKTVVQGKYDAKVFYGDVALLTLSPAGKTIGSAVFPASLFEASTVADMSLVVGDANTYILFNNTVPNMELPETKEAKTLKARGQAVPVKYTYANNSVNKEYLFKKPKEEKGNPYCDFSACHYSPVSKKCAVLYIDPEKDKACLMYVHLN